MIDIKYIREDKEKVKENIRKKFQDEKLEIVDEIEKLDKEYRDIKKQGDDLRALKNSKSSLIGTLMREQKKDEAEKIKLEISEYGKKIEELTQKEEELSKVIKEKMMIIPNFIDKSVPIGKDDSPNEEIEKFGEPRVPN